MPRAEEEAPGHLEPTRGRVPPNDLDAEACLLSAVMLDKAQIDVLVERGLQPVHFYSDANRRIYEAALELHQAGSPVDVVTVAGFLRDRGRLGQIGGAPYLGQIADATPFIAHVAEHADLVVDRFRRRRLIQIAQHATAAGYEPMESTQAFLEHVETEVSELAHARAVVKLEPVGTIAAREVTRIAEAVRTGTTTRGLQTGFPDLDQMIGGLYPGDLTIVAARPGMGKTAFLTSILANVTRAKDYGKGGVPSAAAMFSLEMPRTQISMRFAVHEALIPMNRVRTSKLSDAEWQKLITACGEMSRAPLWVDDTPTLGLLELRSMIRKLKREIRSGAAAVPSSGLAVVGVDYLQLMQGIARRGGTREEEVASLSRGLKAIAKEEEVPILCLSQLNRNVEKNKDKRPGLADLRESGSIEQDADNVWFIYRDGYYDKEADQRVTEIIIAKQRSGPTGYMSLAFSKEEMRFYSLMPDNYDWDQQADGDYFDPGGR